MKHVHEDVKLVDHQCSGRLALDLFYKVHLYFKLCPIYMQMYMQMHYACTCTLYMYNVYTMCTCMYSRVYNVHEHVQCTIHIHVQCNFHVHACTCTLYMLYLITDYMQTGSHHVSLPHKPGRRGGGARVNLVAVVGCEHLRSEVRADSKSLGVWVGRKTINVIKTC